MRTIAEFHSPGTLFTEETTRTLPDGRDVDAAVRLAPAHAFMFYFYDLPEVDFEYDHERFAVRPIAQNRSGRYYLGGTILTAEEIARGAYSDILKSNVRGNGWDRVIYTRSGNWQPFEAGDVLLPDPSERAR